MSNRTIAILREMALVRTAQIEEPQKEKLLAQMKVQLTNEIEKEEKASGLPAKPPK